MLVVLVLGCEKSSTEQPPVPPPRDAAPADAFVDRVRIDALDRLYTYFATTPRTQRSPVEANEQLTHAYREWIFAYGYARAGKPARVAELVMTAKSRLETVADDPVHRWLADAYAQRVTDALAGKRSTAPLASSLDAQLRMLDRVERYKVDRLRESSRVLNARDSVDAIGAFSKRIKDWRGASFEDLRGMVDPEARAKLLAKLAVGAEPLGLVGVLEEARGLPATQAQQVLGAVLAQPGLDAQVWTSALMLAHAVVPARLPALVAQASPVLDQLGAPELENLVRTVGKTHHTELAAIWKRVEPIVDDSKRTSPRLAAAFAAGLVQLGDPNGTARLAKLEQALAGDMKLIDRLELSRGLALAFAQLPQAEAIAGIERIARQFPNVTDSFSTNSHYAKSVLELIDIAVVGVVDE